MTPTGTRKASKPSVRAPYTFEYVRGILLAQHEALDAKGKKTSWRKIAKIYGVSHAVIHRIAVYGLEPKDPKIRHALGLSHTVKGDIPICPICDQPYTPRHRCAAQPAKYAPHPVMRLSRIQNALFGFGSQS